MQSLYDTPRHTRIAQLNDQFRHDLGFSALPGCLVCTGGIAGLPPDIQMSILAHVRGFDDFSAENDPYAEHDFGAFEQDYIGKIFWKIDYYADASMQWGSADAADPTQSFRVLSIMLAKEY